MTTDWLEIWRDLITANPHTPDSSPIKRYKDHALNKKQRPDLLLDFVIQSIDNRQTVLDIGAGNGRWTVPLAAVARKVTAVEPDKEMLNLLHSNLRTAAPNVQVVLSTWEEATVEVHDVAVCAHAMYSSPDLAHFVHKMEEHARKACFLAIRLPPFDGVLAELSNIIYSWTYDSANAVIAYNALYSLGIYVNVLVEKDIYPWVNDTLEEAFLRVKRHLHLENTGAWDRLIQDTLNKRLTYTNGTYMWPDGMRSALLWWNPAK